MKKYLRDRILQMVIVLIVVSLFSFFIMYFAPGDPMNMYIGAELSEEEEQLIKEDLGLDKPVWQQYIVWGKKVLTGDWGLSLVNRQPVIDQILEKLPATLSLMGISLIFSFVCAIPLGLLAGKNQNKLIDKIINMFVYFGISIPGFWFGLLLIITFSLKLHWLPSNGMRTVGDGSLLDIARHMVLPVIVLSIDNIAVLVKYIRSSTISQLQEEYVVTAKAKGVPKAKIMTHHILKNCLLPVITIAGMHLAGLVTGSFIVESVFGWPGMGTLGVKALNSRDYPMIMGCTILSCVLVIIGNLIADILYGVADPRINERRASIGRNHTRN